MDNETKEALRKIDKLAARISELETRIGATDVIARVQPQHSPTRESVLDHLEAIVSDPSPSPSESRRAHLAAFHSRLSRILAICREQDSGKRRRPPLSGLR